VDTIDWLLDSDPAIRWQAMRDLTDASPEAVGAERARVPREGVGAEILAHQGSDGSWPGPAPPSGCRLSTRCSSCARPASTAPSLRSTPRWHVSRRASGGTRSSARSDSSRGEVEPCINGGTLALGAYFGRPTESLARRLVGEQLDDGGWNCEAPKSARSSFHTTICVLEGLLEYERAVGSAPEIAAARRRGEQYLLERGLFRRRSTGEVANPAFLKFAFPPRYHYDVIRALDHLRDAGIQPDARIGDALHVVESLQQADGRWLLDSAHDEALAFPFGESVGQPSRWNTLRALRVLRWYERARRSADSSEAPHPNPGLL
jgi:hypothetical protein